MISFKSILPFTKHKFEDLFEEANYKITLRFSFFLCISLILLYLTQFISYDLNRSNLILFATVVSFIFYFYTLKTGEYKKPALIGSYVYAIIIEMSLYSIPKNPTISDYNKFKNWTVSYMLKNIITNNCIFFINNTIFFVNMIISNKEFI